MTLSLIPADDRVRRFVCTGGETVFNITFPVFAAADVQVLRVRALVTTTLAQPSDYTVAGAGGPSGFTVTLTAPALAGDVVVVVSAQPASRTAQWTDGQALRAQALNAEFARWWIALQQIRRDSVRAIKTPITDPLTSIEMPPAADRANRFLAFNAVGEPIAVGSPDAPLGAVARTGDTILGDLTLAGPPTAPLHAATKQYVDNRTKWHSSGPITPSGPSVSFVGLPRDVTEIRFIYNDVTTSGPASSFIQLGSGSFATSGYRCHEVRFLPGSVLMAPNFLTSASQSSRM